MSERHHLYQTLSFKISVGFILLAALVSTATCTIGFYKYQNTIQRLYNESAYTIAHVAASYIDGDRIAGYLETKAPDAAYTEMASRLDTLRESSDAAYLFVYVPKDELIHYIYDAKNGSMPQMPLGSTDPLSVKYRDLVHQVYNTGEIADNYFISQSRYGYNTSAILPITDSTGSVSALVNVDVPMRIIRSALVEYLVTAVGIGTMLVFLFVFLYLSYLRRRVIAPIRLITENAAAFVHRRKGFSEDVLKIRTGDEIETLASALAKMEVDITQYIESLAKVTADKERIATELAVATQIQNSMLPCIFPAFPDREEFDIYASMHAAKEVGGDFYDFFLIDRSHLGVVMADVSGKGVPAALFMVIAKTLIKNHAQVGRSPAEVFEIVNNQLCENNEAGMFVTAFMGVLEIETGVFTYVNAGHNPPLVTRDAKPYEWLASKRGFVLAGMENMKYFQQEILLKSGDSLFLYTDGVTEALNPRKELYSEARLLAILNAHRSEHKSLFDQLELIRKDIEAFADGEEQADDITMLLLKISERGDENG